MRVKFLRTLLPLLLLSAPLMDYCQVQLTGPTCVVAGTVYQYIITGHWDSSSTMHLCIAGGTWVGHSDSCTSDQPPVPFVQIIWNHESSGAVNLQSTAGNAQIQVTITTPLSGGSIVDSCKADTIPYNGTPPLINCTPATGGACSPSYSYQWQVSVDNIQWQDVDGATGLSCSPGQALQNTSYYRRKVIETVSSTISYSDAACIIVNQGN